MKFVTPLFAALTLCTSLQAQTTYTMPDELGLHEGTWLQWPHHYTYGTTYRDRLDQTFIDMTAALITSEKVHVIVYNSTEKTRVTGLLNNAAVSLDSVDFYIIKTDDVWSRDNGPMYVYNNTTNALTILDWGFDGWGDDTPFALDNKVPTKISNKTAVPKVNLSAMVLEGGAVQVDGSGTFMATRSSIQDDGRNDGLTETDINNYLTQYLGVTNIIWLDGYYGAGWDITDAHIDGFAVFLDDQTIVTMDDGDLNYWGLSPADRTTLYNAQNAAGENYDFVYLPLTDKNVKTTWGLNVGFKASYVNYYVANTVVLVPTYNDVNDDEALAIVQSIYPDKTVIGIDNRNIYFYGGMVHCVTQQQPVDLPMRFSETTISNESTAVLHQNVPNPFHTVTEISFTVIENSDIRIEILNNLGERMYMTQFTDLQKGNYSIPVHAKNLNGGMYYCVLYVNGMQAGSCKMLVNK